MTDKVLTDEKIEALMCPSYTMLGFARAVEAAVLAKCVKFTDGSYAHFRDGHPVVSEVEARERERRAFVIGWNRGTLWSCKAPDCATQESEKNACYPSLKPVEPPPLVLETGVWTWVEDESGWRRAPNEISDSRASPIIQIGRAHV